MDYNSHNVRDAVQRIKNFPGASVLVVGCNAGGDCRTFIEMGAGSVCGLDVDDNIGADFRDPRVEYRQEPIERASFPSDAFDVVFCYATMEHVTGIEEGFQQMARMTKPGGILYSLASPLWCSPMGHHMGNFAAHPWVHLVHDREALLAFARANGISGEGGAAIKDTVAYMTDVRYFNMRRPADYLAAAKRLPEMKVIEHEIICLPREEIEKHPNGREALARGFTEQDLLGVTHRYVARKRRSLWRRVREGAAALRRP
jgi:SAM-dependent methyltransferase